MRNLFREVTTAVRINHYTRFMSHKLLCCEQVSRAFPESSVPGLTKIAVSRLLFELQTSFCTRLNRNESLFTIMLVLSQLVSLHVCRAIFIYHFRTTLTLEKEVNKKNFMIKYLFLYLIRLLYPYETKRLLHLELNIFP